MWLKTACATAALLALGSFPSLADDWTATRLRGGVFVLTDGAWVQLHRGSVVSDDRVIKSAPGSRATFVRDAETIEVGPDTTVQIADGNGFTTVYNHKGTVGIDAEVRNVQHFAVQTEYLAAVVKGTAFVVQTDATTSTVAVTRGSVEVDDERHGSTLDVTAGQQVSTKDTALTVRDVVPVSADLPKPPPPVAPDSTPRTASAAPVTSEVRADQVQNTGASERGSNAGSAGNAGSGNGNGKGTNGNDAGNGNGNGANSNSNDGTGNNGNGNGSNGNGNNGNGSGGNGNGNNGNGNNGNGNGNGSNGNANNGNGNNGNGNGNNGVGNNGNNHGKGKKD
ncbi:MAG TPA: FecR domain-containing protein [Devosia sp.]|nr:FecR domain-containing protein [Devosia sp.]